MIASGSGPPGVEAVDALVVGMIVYILALLGVGDAEARTRQLLVLHGEPVTSRRAPARPVEAQRALAETLPLPGSGR